MMADTLAPAKRSWLPDTGKRFWRIVLVASLVLNLAIIGLLVGRVWHGNPMDHPPVNYGMFVPKRFFSDISGERRSELGQPFRDSKVNFEALRAQADANAGKLAEILVRQDFNIADVNAMIDTFTTGPDSVAAKGSQVLKDFFAKLTPEERALLAKDIIARRDGRAKK
jgi:uncharacterized membrane protein